MPYMSVVVPTMRVGGLDVLFSGLRGQSFRDFELILSDGLHGRRRDMVAEASQCGFPVVHVPPRDNPFPVNSFCRYANTGLTHASGEVILFATDYTWFPPGCLGFHAAFHRSHGPEWGLMCPHEYSALPPCPRFPGYGRDGVDAYVADLDSGSLDQVMWSLFEEPFDQDASLLPPDPVMRGADPKLRLPPGSVQPTYFHAKNESCRLERVLSVNGWDEDLDGAHCYQDSDVAERLSVLGGMSWYCDPSNVAFIVNPRHSFPHPRRLRSIGSNEAIWHRKRALGYPPVNPEWNIIMARADAGVG